MASMPYPVDNQICIQICINMNILVQLLFKVSMIELIGC